MKSRQMVIGLVALSGLLIVVGIVFQLGIIEPKSHAISRKAIATWGLALVSLVAASFARPERT